MATAHPANTCYTTKSSIAEFQCLFEDAVFHCEDKQASAHAPISKPSNPPSWTPRYLKPSHKNHKIVASLVSRLQRHYGKSYPWAIGKGCLLATSWPKRTAFQSGRPIISFVDSPFRPMLNIWARLIFQLIPVACPDHFASGDVYRLLTILQAAPTDGDLILVNHDLAGFFTSIDQARFMCAWHMLLDFLCPHI